MLRYEIVCSYNNNIVANVVSRQFQFERGKLINVPLWLLDQNTLTCAVLKTVNYSNSTAS